MTATEGLEALLHPSSKNEELQSQAQAGAWRSFEIRRLAVVPEDTDERIFHVLHLASLAYCGDRWSDLRRWIKENEAVLKPPSVASEPWDTLLVVYHDLTGQQKVPVSGNRNAMHFAFRSK